MGPIVGTAAGALDTSKTRMTSVVAGGEALSCARSVTGVDPASPADGVPLMLQLPSGFWLGPVTQPGAFSTLMLTLSPGSGSAVGNGDGTITYTPDQDFFGSDGFTYGIGGWRGIE